MIILISLSSDQVMEGNIIINDQTIYYASGATLAVFPTNNSHTFSAELKDQS